VRKLTGIRGIRAGIIAVPSLTGVRFTTVPVGGLRIGEIIALVLLAVHHAQA
jgi:hypothetical protein